MARFSAVGRATHSLKLMSLFDVFDRGECFLTRGCRSLYAWRRNRWLLFDGGGCTGRVFVDPLPHTFLHPRKFCWRQVEERRCRNKMDAYSGPCPWRAVPNRKIGLEVKPCLSRFNEHLDNCARRSRLVSCPADEARTRHILHARSAAQHKCR